MFKYSSEQDIHDVTELQYEAGEGLFHADFILSDDCDLLSLISAP